VQNARTVNLWVTRGPSALSRAPLCYVGPQWVMWNLSGLLRVQVGYVEPRFCKSRFTLCGVNGTKTVTRRYYRHTVLTVQFLTLVNTPVTSVGQSVSVIC